MSSQDQEDTTIYKVVLNHEEQYSIWPQDRENPLGWRDAGKSGLKAECLDYIKEVWTDMRPLSLRKHMEEAGRNSSPPEEGSVAEEDQAGTVPPGPARDELVNCLSEGNHPVEVSLRPDRTVSRLKECIDRDYVHIKFTDTRGGTELGVRIDRDASDWHQADFQTGKGVIHLVGRLTLNYVKVQCVADIDLATLAGQGHLEPEEVSGRPTLSGCSPPVEGKPR